MPQFTPGELEVMRILWERGERKPAEIQREFPKPIKNAALRSYLSILLEKGHVMRRREGKVYYYKAKTRQQSAFRRMLRELIDAYCGGSETALLMALLKREDLSDSEILELRRLAEEDSESAKPGSNNR